MVIDDESSPVPAIFRFELSFEQIREELREFVLTQFTMGIKGFLTYLRKMRLEGAIEVLEMEEIIRQIIEYR